MVGGIEDSLESRIRVSNILILSFKYLIDFPQISFLTSDIARYILNRQINKGDKSHGLDISLEGAWCELNGVDGSLSTNEIVLSGEIYDGIVYQTSRALEALGHARGMSMAPIIRGFKFMDRFIGRINIDSVVETKYFVPIMDAIYSCSDAVSYDQSQKLLIPLANRICEIVRRVDPKIADIHTQEIVFKAKLIEGLGLSQRDLEVISNNLEMKVMRHVLKSIESVSYTHLTLPTTERV